MSDTRNPKKSPQGDWHRADIVAALHKAGWSLRALAKHYGYSHPNTINTALNRPWPKGEKIICDAIRQGGEYPNIKPADIWPSRYLERTHNTPRKKSTRSSKSRNVKPVKVM